MTETTPPAFVAKLRLVVEYDGETILDVCEAVRELVDKAKESGVVVEARLTVFASDHDVSGRVK